MMNLTRHWYHSGPTAFLLWPLSQLFCGIAALRRKRLSAQQSDIKLNVPIIVVGNISVGGTGKTPMVIWLAELLRREGYHPGIVSRGYGGKAGAIPTMVTAASDAKTVGDEAVLIARRTACPMWVGHDRVFAIQKLLEFHRGIDVIISDDGLQHYRMPRDIEVAMIDGARRFGNELCLPAGPLREPVSRLEEVDFRVVTGSLADDNEYTMELGGDEIFNLRSSGKQLSLSMLQDVPVHAVAGIGNPSRFFMRLEQAGLKVTRHHFPDHHVYQPEDLGFGDERMIIMTEKDAVKCSVFADQRFWYLPVKAQLERRYARDFLNKLKELGFGQKTA
jgi:tetraacyldisaccharide 4'-kinase